MRDEGTRNGMAMDPSAAMVFVAYSAFSRLALTHFPHPLKFHGDRSKQ